MTEQMQIELKAIKERISTFFQLKEEIDHELELWENGGYALILIVPKRIYHAMCTSCASRKFTQKHKNEFPETMIQYITFSYKKSSMMGE